MKKLLEMCMSAGRTLHAAGMTRRSERGALDIGAILLMGIGMVFLAVGFIMFPIVTTATDSLLAYTYTPNAAGCLHSTFTGFDAIVGITPLLVLVGYLSAAVFSMYLGVKMMKGGTGGTKLDLGTILMLGLALIFIALGLIILPVTLDGICSVIHGGGTGINSSYVGLAAILEITPLLVLISFIAAAVITGFFGLKRLGSS